MPWSPEELAKQVEYVYGRTTVFKQHTAYLYRLEVYFERSRPKETVHGTLGYFLERSGWVLDRAHWTITDEGQLECTSLRFMRPKGAEEVG